jgi:hypothetical protein
VLASILHMHIKVNICLHAHTFWQTLCLLTLQSIKCHGATACRALFSAAAVHVDLHVQCCRSPFRIFRGSINQISTTIKARTQLLTAINLSLLWGSTYMRYNHALALSPRILFLPRFVSCMCRLITSL